MQLAVYSLVVPIILSDSCVNMCVVRSINLLCKQTFNSFSVLQTKGALQSVGDKAFVYVFVSKILNFIRQLFIYFQASRV